MAVGIIEGGGRVSHNCDSSSKLNNNLIILLLIEKIS